MSMRYARCPTIVERKIRDEYLLVPLHGDRGRLDSLYTLNETAALIWTALAEDLTESQITDRLTKAYDVDSATALTDVQHVLRELLAIGAITRTA